MPMRELRSCDFCGGDAAGVYEVLPPELSPTEAEQRRIVLCSNCAGTLETVVDPLLDRLGVGTGDGASVSDTGGESAERSVAAEVSAADDADGADLDSGAANPSPTADPESGGDGEEPVQWGESTPTDDGGSADPSEPVHNGTSGTDPSDDADSMGTESGTGTSEPADGSADALDANDAADEAAATDGDDSTLGDEPEDFRTVMRLLANRDFPVERDAIVDLAASAYELDVEHVHRILDHAIDRGVLAEDGGTLRRN